MYFKVYKENRDNERSHMGKSIYQNQNQIYKYCIEPEENVFSQYKYIYI